uniref:Protein BUD31 homolog n=1 Tax=Xenopus tropicalis TaxID=8364 RepID=A0A803J1Y7_XENTR
MPKVKRSRKPPPDGWELIEPTLDELDQKMREAETEPHEGKRKVESLWPIFRIHHQKTRYIFDLFYKRKAISRELYDYCIREGYADKNLIAKWKKQGYENLCCLRCIQTRDTNFGTNCICRVPKTKLEVVNPSLALHGYITKVSSATNWAMLICRTACSWVCQPTVPDFLKFGRAPSCQVGGFLLWKCVIRRLDPRIPG